MSTLLIGDPFTSWRDFLRTFPIEKPLLILDPKDAEFGTPARLKVVENKKIVWERFYGSLDPLRAPHVLVSALAQGLTRWGQDLNVLCFDYRPNPILNQTVSLIAQLTRPTRIIVSSRCDLDLGGFPIGPETIELPTEFPEIVQLAQRRARWSRMLEEGVEQTVDLKRISMEAGRLRTGKVVSHDQIISAGLEQAIHAEILGSTLFLVSKENLTDRQKARVTSLLRTERIISTQPTLYENLICSVADQSGSDFGFGKIERIDWQHLIATLKVNTPPPAPIRILRLGSVRVDEFGTELGEVKPWEV